MTTITYRSSHMPTLTMIEMIQSATGLSRNQRIQSSCGMMQLQRM